MAIFAIVARLQPATLWCIFNFHALARAPCHLEIDDPHAELMLIDESLFRNDLSPADCAGAQAPRMVIYQQLNPETKSGGNQSGRIRQFGQTESARYDERVAEATGQSERTVRPQRKPRAKTR